MKKILQLLILLVCCTACDSCEREYPEIDFKLPAETQTGAHTFGFLVNGKVWTNYGQHCIYSSCRENLKSEIIVINNDSVFRILADMYIRENKQDKLDQNFTLYKAGIDSAGTYLIAGLYHYTDMVEFYDRIAQKQYETYHEKPPFKLTITRLDTLNKVASGRLEGVLYNRKDLKDSIIISEGRFDLKLGE